MTRTQSGLNAPGRSLPCQAEDADLWFAERPAELGRAQQLCRQCPAQAHCLTGALQRREPWGVWGGEIFERGRVVLFKRNRGRPAKPRPSVRAEHLSGRGLIVSGIDRTTVTVRS